MIEVRWLMHIKESGETIKSGWNADFISWRKSYKYAQEHGGITSVQLQVQKTGKLYTLSAKDIGKDTAQFFQKDYYEFHSATGKTVFIARSILMELEKDKWLILKIILSNGEVKAFVSNEKIKVEK